jgi:hypothetical protein
MEDKKVFDIKSKLESKNVPKEVKQVMAVEDLKEYYEIEFIKEIF